MLRLERVELNNALAYIMDSMDCLEEWKDEHGVMRAMGYLTESKEIILKILRDTLKE